MEEGGLSQRRRGWGGPARAGCAAIGRIELRISFVFPADTAVFRVFHYDTRIRELLPNLVGAFEVAPLLRRVALFDQRFDFRAAHARLRRTKTKLGELVRVVVGEQYEDRVEFLHGRDHTRRILLAEFATVHRGVHIAHQIEHSRKSQRRVQIICKPGVEIRFRLRCSLVDFRIRAVRKSLGLEPRKEISQAFHGILRLRQSVHR